MVMRATERGEVVLNARAAPAVAAVARRKRKDDMVEDVNLALVFVSDCEKEKKKKRNRRRRKTHKFADSFEVSFGPSLAPKL
jgi:hypothetical protein